MSDDTLLSPGQLIRPIVTKESAIQIFEKLYGLKVSKITELNAYDDKNYHVLCDETKFDNPHITEVSKHGYVLKIVNSLDSKKTNVIEAQSELMLFLNKKGILCPLPVKCISGSYYSLENLKTGSEEKNAVRLLIFRPGKLLIRVPKTNELMTEVGKYVATFGEIIQQFSHSAYNDHESIWMLNYVPKIAEFLYVLESEEDKRIVSDVIISFEEKVLRSMDRFDKGIIHGDLNEQNIVMSLDEKTISAVIDFGDSHRSCLIFDLTICLCYMLLQTEDLETGKFFIRGYETVKCLSHIEKSIIKICVCARLCQSLVLGLYSSRNDPKNEYILTTQKSGWKLLKKIWSMSDEQVSQIWGIN